ncbi:MAG: PilZ domain-containing protein [Phycisphaerae bacterium]|nr:PilZ domain-containing protein [Phycisphaerae bacterium]
MEDRRQHYRLPISLPVEVSLSREAGRLTTTSSNVSAGGVRFLCSGETVRPGERVSLRLIIPPAPGRSSRVTAMETDATVLRVESTNHDGPAQRYAVACRFSSPLRFN